MSLFSIKAEVLRFKGNEWSSKMDEQMTKLIKEAARRFLVAAIRRIPVRTGFLRGAFTTLEDVVGALSLASTQGKVTRKGNILTEEQNKIIAKGKKLFKLRKIQQKRLEQIRLLRKAEENRSVEIANIHQKHLERLAEFAGKAVKHGPNKGRLVADVLTEQDFRQLRVLAVNERRARLGLLEKFERDTRQLRKVHRQLEEKLDGALSKSLNERRATLIAKIERAHIKNELKFFNRLKNINRQNIDFDVKERLINQARERLKVRTGRLDRLKTLQDAFGKRVEKLKRTLNKRLDRKLARLQARVKSFKPSEATLKRLKLDRARVEKFIRRSVKAGSFAKGRIIKEKEAVLRTLLEAQTKHSFNELQRLHNIENRFHESEGLNLVPRVSRGKTPKPEELTHLREYYTHYGAHHVLKTPRSGRIFSTPSALIFTKKQVPSHGAFTQLRGISKASNINFNIPTEYAFNFNVLIRYLAINDIKHGWLAWQSGILAFRQYLIANALQAIPSLLDFMVKDRLTLTGTTVTRG